MSGIIHGVDRSQNRITRGGLVTCYGCNWKDTHKRTSDDTSRISDVIAQASFNKERHIIDDNSTEHDDNVEIQVSLCEYGDK